MGCEIAMNINATLLVQAGNFLIAYLLFRLILLKPAYAVIEQEDAVRDSLEEEIMHGQEQLNDKKEFQKKQWLQVHQFYKKNQPTLPEQQMFYQGMRSSVSLESFSHQEVDLLARELSSAIVERVGNSK